MPRNHAIRGIQPGGRFFFTVVTQGRLPILIEHIGHLRRAFRITMDRHPFILEAVCVLPDHLHAIWRMPPEDGDYSLRWMVLKRLFSSRFEARPASSSQRAKREKGVWQRRFMDHRIRDDEDWRRHLEYLLYNPVKHGYCGSPAEWPHSSFAEMTRRGWYPRDWGAFAPTAAPNHLLIPPAASKRR